MLQRLPGNQLVVSGGRAASARRGGVRGCSGAAGSASGRGRDPVYSRRTGGADQEEPEGGGGRGTAGHPRGAPRAEGEEDTVQGLLDMLVMGTL